ncbi:M15 family metallopeptidase [Oscillospiraceae bacterium PP1C4]
MKKMIYILAAISMLAGCSARVETVQPSERSQVVTESVAADSSSQPDSSADSSAPDIGGQEAVSDPGDGVSDPMPSSLPDPASRPSQQEPESDATWALSLVNYENAIPEDFAPELAEVQNGYKMDARVAGVMKQMIADAKAQGIDLLVCSAYRPYSSQKRNFDSSVNSYVSAGYNKDEAVVETMKLIAQPGKSEHQTGLAADIVTPNYQGLDDGYADTAAAKWLAKNAPDYGFILRYPKDKTDITKIDFEPWHFRYVGKDAAKEITSKGICLEEYLEK